MTEIEQEQRYHERVVERANELIDSGAISETDIADAMDECHGRSREEAICLAAYRRAQREVTE